jgi:hypothetical protein
VKPVKLATFVDEMMRDIQAFEFEVRHADPEGGNLELHRDVWMDRFRSWRTPCAGVKPSLDESVRVNINGEVRACSRLRPLSYREIVRFAFPQAAERTPFPILSVVYRGAAGGKSGSLFDGQGVFVEEGTMIDAADTSRG